MKTIRLILVCDDDEEDQVLVKEAFSEAYPGIQFRFANDGIELIEYLKNYPRPDVILLDINMPRLGGVQTLTWIKAHINYRANPIVMFTTSTLPEDIEQCYALGADSYMTKCASFDKLLDKVKSFAGYWIETRSVAPKRGCLKREP